MDTTSHIIENYSASVPHRDTVVLMTKPKRSRKKHPHYDYSRVESYDAIYNYVVGARGLGKTYGRQKRLIARNIRTGEQFIWLRRYKPETQTARNTFFAAVGQEFPDWEFRTNGWEMQRAHAESRGEKKREWITMGYFVSLSTAQSTKGTSFDAVTEIVFDEFIIEKGSNLQYIGNEAETFLGFYDTVDRNQDKTKVFFLANSVSIMNPYFIEYEIRPDQMGEITAMRRDPVTKQPYIVVHFPDSAEYKASISSTRRGRFIAGTDYEKYAVSNEFKDNNASLIGKKPGTARPLFNLETKHGQFSVWYDRGPNQYFVQEKLINDGSKMFTIVPENMDENRILFTYTDKPLAYLRTALRQGSVIFKSPRARNAFIDILKR